MFYIWWYGVLCHAIQLIAREEITKWVDRISTCHSSGFALLYPLYKNNPFTGFTIILDQKYLGMYYVQY